MDSFLQEKYGDDIFFLTYSGAVLSNNEIDYTIAIRDFIWKQKISTIYFVNDISCRFINGIINKSKLIGLASEKILEEIYIEHYLSDFIGKPLINQQYKLAELNIKQQVHEILNAYFFRSLFCERNIEVKGLITSKNKNLIKELNLEKNQKYIYEL
jgi:hypothetical protein